MIPWNGVEFETFQCFTFNGGSVKVSRSIAVAILSVAATVVIVAQTKQPQDEEYAKLVKEWTTQPELHRVRWWTTCPKRPASRR